MKSKVKTFYSHLVNFLSDHSLAIILIIALTASLTTDIWSYQHNYITAYGDAKSHLNISRRVFDNLNPGLAQLGSAWLPLLHVLMFSFILNDFLYYSGLAGTIVSFVFYLLSNVYLFKLIAKLTKNNIIGLIGTLIFTLNINVLYMQSTPMTETIASFFIIAVFYYFFTWQESRKLSHLIILSSMIFLGTFTRYELWVYAPAIFVGIVFTYLGNKLSVKNFKELESNLIIFCFCGLFGIFLWLLWNLLIFNDPLYFLHSVYSAEAYQRSLISRGLNRPYHNIFYATQYYLQSVADVSSWVLIILGFVGSIYAFLKRKILIMFGLFIVSFSVFAFETYAIYKGNTTIYVPELFPYDYYNIRYGIYALPFFALFSSVLLLIKNKFFKFLVLSTIFILIAYPLYKFKPITLDDSISPKMKKITINAERDFQNFFAKNYHGGLILITAGDSDGLIYVSHIALKKFITEGNQKYWQESLKNPSKYASWIVLRDARGTRSLLTNTLWGSPKISNHFDLVYEKYGVLIYKKNK